MKSFIINRMYAGEYLTRGIGGGEVINLLHSDDEKNPQSFQSLLEMINNKELWFEKVVKINDNLKHNY